MKDRIKLSTEGSILPQASRSHLRLPSFKSSCFSSMGWRWGGEQALPLWWWGDGGVGGSTSYITGRHSSRRQVQELSSEASLAL